MTTYDTVWARFPPSLSVITPAAAAVGQMRHSIAHSRRILMPSSCVVIAIRANPTNVTLWKRRARRCHLVNPRSCGEIFTNCRNSMSATRSLWTSTVTLLSTGPAECRNGEKW